MTSAASTFDSAATAYEQQLQQGLSLSGESADYFVNGRVTMLAGLLAEFHLHPPRHILDFGCGVGNATQALLSEFENARVTGVDCSSESIAIAARKHSSLPSHSHRLNWATTTEQLEPMSIDLTYTSGVFHHIEPRQRQDELSRILLSLRPGGTLALFENNPWNPGTRWIMSRIPFDRDAICLSPIETQRRVQAAGFNFLATRYLFFFPRMLSSLRYFERPLDRLPLGAQYVVFAQRPPS